MAKRFRRQIINTDPVVNRLQESCGEYFDFLTKIPFLDGQMLRGVSLVSGANTVPHLLAREPLGWFITNRDSAATVYQSSKDTVNLTLQASATITVDIWVF